MERVRGPATTGHGRGRRASPGTFPMGGRRMLGALSRMVPAALATNAIKTRIKEGRKSRILHARFNVFYFTWGGLVGPG